MLGIRGVRFFRNNTDFFILILTLFLVLPLFFWVIWGFWFLYFRTFRVPPPPHFFWFVCVFFWFFGGLWAFRVPLPSFLFFGPLSVCGFLMVRPVAIWDLRLGGLFGAIEVNLAYLGIRLFAQGRRKG